MDTNLTVSAYYSKKQLNEYISCNFHDEEGTCYCFPSEVEIYYFLTRQTHSQLARGYIERNFPDYFTCNNLSTALIRNVNINNIEEIDFKVDYSYYDLSEHRTGIFAHPDKCKPYISDHFVLSLSDSNLSRKISAAERNQLTDHFLMLQHDTLLKKVFLFHKSPCHEDLRQKISIGLKMRNQCHREFDFVLKLYHDDDDQ